MKRFLTSSLIASAAFVGATITSQTIANAQENHVAILIDGSSSYGIMHDKGFANRIANDLVDRLPSFKMRDRVTLMPIGDYSYSNPVKELQVSKKLPMSRMPAMLSGLVVSFPDMIRKRGAPKSTNILGALDKLSRRMDCPNSSGHVYVLSDGAETGQKMALPSEPLFKGCERFVVLGLGGKTPAETKELGAFWNRWCQKAGFKSCDWLS